MASGLELLAYAYLFGTGVQPAVKVLSDVGSWVKSAVPLFKGQKVGDARVLSAEFAHILLLCKLVAEKGIPAGKVVPDMPTAEFDRLLRSEFKFNCMQPKKVVFNPDRDPPSLRRLDGNSTEELIQNVYTKIHAVKTRYAYNPEDPAVKILVANIRRRTELLLRHLTRPR